jgi:hypothetical protein
MGLELHQIHPFTDSVKLASSVKLWRGQPGRVGSAVAGFWLH